MSRRMILCRERPEVALLLYGSAEQSWRKLGEKLGSSAIPSPQPGEKDMRQIEATADYKAAMATVVAKYHLLNDLEWTMWSKRSHGDIYALVEVSQELAVRDGNVRRAANKTRRPEKEVDAMLQRGAGFILVAFNALVSEFGIDTRGRLKDLADKYERLQQRHDGHQNT
ncbi:MAG TPA: hypothetical protein VGU66_23045 [Candidatus Elarobacter sp.]|nr:hypothetical protein [Candidatus Elarobacter sp.]